MKNQRSLLMALAMASIVAVEAKATTIIETTDFSNSTSSPTSLGAFSRGFNPAFDSIQGTVKGADFLDAILLSGAPGSTVSLLVSLYNPDPAPNLQLGIYDNAGNVGLIATRFYSTPTASDTITFIVPPDGNYMVSLNLNAGGGGYGYTLGAVPEPGTAVLLTAALGVAALLRVRQAPRKA